MVEKPQFFTPPIETGGQKNEPIKNAITPANFLTSNIPRELPRRTPETVQEHRKIVTEGLTRYGAAYNESISLNENIRRLKILKSLEDGGVIEINDGAIVLDPIRISEWKTQLYNEHSWSFATNEMILALNGLRGYSRKEFDENKSGDKKGAPLRDLVAIPESAQALPEFIKESRDSIANIWDFGRLHDWEMKIKARNGKDELTMFELRVAVAIFGELRGRRDERGRLMIYDDARKQERPFSPNLFRKLTKTNFSISAGHGNKKREISFSGSPMVFVSKYGQNLLKTGLLKKEDFRMNSGSSTSELFDLERYQLIPGRSNYVLLRGRGGHSARYYVGKTKVVGTEIPISENIAIVKLDPETAGVVENRLGVLKLLCVIALFSPEEVQKRRENVRQEYITKHHRQLAPMELTARTAFNGGDVESRVSKYDITKYIPQRDGESAADYGRRIDDLQNVDFVIKTSRDFFSSVNIGIHNLPWSEQLVLANAIFEAPSPEKLKEFALQYGKNGVRTFLSLDYRKDLGHKIVELGNALEPKAASEIFAKYGQIIDATHDVEAYITEHFSDQATMNEAVVARITENLLRRAKDLLVHFADALAEARRRGSALDTDSVLRELSNVRTETLLFLSSFKTLRSQGVNLDFEAIKDVEFYSTSGPTLSEDDLRRMEEIYAKNYADVPALRDELLAIFKNSAKNKSAEFYILRYKGDIIGFARFDDEGEGKMHFSSFNVDTQFRGSAIGGVILEKTVDLKARDHVLSADCRVMTDIGSHYIETGFVAKRLYDYKGEPCLAIERNDAAPYRARSLSEKEIVHLCESGVCESDGMIITSSENKNPDELELNRLNGGGFVLTRFFAFNKKKWYCVFEKANEATLSSALEGASENKAA